MSQYENQNCPVCNRPLLEGDDIAVCPVCGAPHHRECFLENGKCAYEDKHGTEEQWQKPEPKAEPQPEAEPEPQPEPERKVPPKMPYTNGFVFASVDPNEDIDGEKAGNIIRFVGVNAMRYLAVFKKSIKNNGFFSWNWMAFLFPDYWLYSRKLYKEGIMVSLINILLNLPILSLYLPQSTDMLVLMNYIGALSKAEILAINMSAFGVIALRVLMGLIGDRLYKKRVYSKLKQLRENQELDPFTLSRAGGVNLFAVAIAYFATEVVLILLGNLLR